MPISRDARMDRRRRLLRDTPDDDTQDNATPRRSARRTAEVDETEGNGVKRKAGYSQDVRKACGQRLVQLIPVRKRSYGGVICLSLLIPGMLLAAHYLIHVTGQLQWWRHPLAIALDIGHPRSIAAWLSSQLWLLCLGATVLTFQLRRHKLDDYNGEYRLWFWLVMTCLIASVDATTNITDLFAVALDPWAQSHLGWSGPAVVDATLTVLIGMLGLRMCSELKTVPLSLIWWLTGLLAWACSAALARPEFQLQLSAPIRYWLTASFWLAGLTMIWLAALTYLRSIYVEAQQRFLLRGRLASSSLPLGERLRQSLPAMPSFRRGERADKPAVTKGGTPEFVPESPVAAGSRWGLPTFLKRGRGQPLDSEATSSGPVSSRRSVSRQRIKAIDEQEVPTTDSPRTAATQRNQTSQSQHSPQTRASTETEDNRREKQTPSTPSRGLGGFLKRSSSSDAVDTDGKSTKRGHAHQTESVESKKSRWGSWLRRAKDNDEADEYRKVSSEEQGTADNQAERQQRRNQRGADNRSDAPQSPTTRRWLPKLSRPKLPRPKISIPKFGRSKPATEPKPATESKPVKEKRSLLSRFKLPSMSLAALRLQPPHDASDTDRSSIQPKELRPVASPARQLPGTNQVDNQDAYFEDDDDENDGRSLSKAERKRLRRNQQQRRSA